ncbi:uncharacterized protein [Miscanthus floridulus]|uniref:uncharacterized protein n=1 Tax=Miscanthus floridulus TaxID=154761 RepID=UPI0034584CB0
MLLRTHDLVQYCNEERKGKRILSMCPEHPSFSPLLLGKAYSNLFSCPIIAGMLLERGSRFSVLLLAPQDKQANISVTPCFPCRLRK